MQSDAQWEIRTGRGKLKFEFCSIQIGRHDLGRMRMNFRRQRRHDERWWKRRPLRNLRDQIAPRLAFLRRHLRPMFGIFQKFRAVFWIHSGKFREGANALKALGWWQFVECLQRLFHLCALGVGKCVECFLFFVRRQLEKLIELIGDFLAFVF